MDIADEPGAIARRLAGLGPDDAIVLEATGGRDRPLRLALRKADHARVRQDPMHARRFARSLDPPRTGRVDAAMLARPGAGGQPAADAAAEPEIEEPRAPVRLRDRPERRMPGDEPPRRRRRGKGREGNAHLWRFV